MSAFFSGMGDVVDALLRLRVDLPEHLEIIVGVDRTVLGRQVADMAKGRQDLVAGAKILIDRLRLGRQLDNDNFHENPMGYPPKPVGFRRNRPLALAGTWGRHPLLSNKGARKTFMNSQFGHRKRPDLTPNTTNRCISIVKQLKGYYSKETVYFPHGDTARSARTRHAEPMTDPATPVRRIRQSNRGRQLRGDPVGRSRRRWRGRAD